jgi:hypothetical protein
MNFCLEEGCGHGSGCTKVALMKKWISAFLIIFFMGMLSGCMSFAVEGDCPKTPDSKFGQETIHGSFYGFNWDDGTRQVRKADDRLGLAKVEYHTNVFYVLLSVVSLGAYVPVDMDYWVEAPKTIQRLPKKMEGDQK